MKLFDQRRILGGTAILAVTGLGASVAGLIRDRLLFSTFPELGVTDVYFAAFRPSDFLFQACIMSALGTVLVPVLAGYHAKGEKHHVNRILSGAMNLGAVVFGSISLLLAIFFPWIARHLVQFEGEQLALYIQFGRLAMLSNFLFVFGSTLGQHLITVQRYWIYGITPILYTLGTIAGTLFLTPYMGAYGPITGTVIGAFIYALLRAFDVARAGVQLQWVFWHADFRDMGMLMLPRMLSLGAFQLQILIFDMLGSGLHTGSISINLAARNFESVGVGVVGIALAQAVYSPLSQAAAVGDRALYVTYLKKSIFYALLLTIPGTIALTLLAPVAAMLVNLTQVLPVFRGVLAIYALAIPLESVDHLLLRASYALKQTMMPSIVSVVGGFTAVAIAWWYVPVYGVYAFAVAYVIGELVQMIGMGSCLPSRIARIGAAKKA